MQAVRQILHTNAEGSLVERPDLPANATIEAIFLLNEEEEPRAHPQHDSLSEVARRMASRGAGDRFGDPVEWQRRIREDRPLPARGEPGGVE